MMRLAIPILVTVLAVSSIGKVSAQFANPSDRDRAIGLIQQGNLPEAIPVLSALVKKNKKDVRAWHWLGVALEKQGKLGDALKAHERAAKIADELQTVAMEDLKSISTSELSEGADSADRFVSLKASLSEAKKKEWRDRTDFLRFFATQSSTKLEIYSSKDVTTKARVISKPEPSYSEDARKNQVTGTIVLRAVFAADGHVRAIRVIHGLEDSLDKRAVDAARHIKFIPAMKDGKPVSMWMQLEYNFNLY